MGSPFDIGIRVDGRPIKDILVELAEIIEGSIQEIGTDREKTWEGNFEITGQTGHFRLGFHVMWPGQPGD